MISHRSESTWCSTPADPRHSSASRARFLLNLHRALAASRAARRIHMRTAGALAVLFCVVLPVFLKLTERPPHEWFFRRGQTEYETMIAKIRRNGTKLTSTNARLSAIVGRSDVYGKTNSDGSMTIDFQGIGNWRVGGYLYYSGGGMTAKAGETNTYFLPDNPTRLYTRLTNGWYAYR